VKYFIDDETEVEVGFLLWFVSLAPMYFSQVSPDERKQDVAIPRGIKIDRFDLVRIRY
jgi:hypothetical protein